MDSDLMCIQKEVAKYIEMITTVFDVHVDIADSNMIRIAGTGRFNKKIGSPFPYGGKVFNRVMQTGRLVFIEHPETNPICQNCINLTVCRGQCELSLPIKLDKDIIGVISIASSNEAQYRQIIDNYDKMVLFMENITDLIALKAREFRDQKLQKYNMQLLDKLINLLDDGVMILDRGNNITYMNLRCEKILGCNMNQTTYLTKIKQFSITEQTSERNEAKEYTVKIRNKAIHLSGKTHEILDVDEKHMNKVFIFNDVKALPVSYDQAVMPKKYTFDYMTGESPSFFEAVEQCRQAAYSFNSVLLNGETGTGKELFARAIHNESIRRNNQFIRLGNGAAVEALIEKVIFNADLDIYENDDARRNELLEGNTLYIDEVGDLSPHNQDSLLSIIQNSQLHNYKVICATSNNLRHMVQKGDFRQDLYYTLDLHTITIPPLRQRGSDILLFVKTYLERYNRLYNKQLTLSREVKELFLCYSWRGNIREVETMISYIVENIALQDGEITAANLPQVILERIQNDKKNLYNLEAMEKEMILKALNDFGKGPKSKAIVAKELGISNATLYRKLKQYNIQQNMLFE